MGTSPNQIGIPFARIVDAVSGKCIDRPNFDRTSSVSDSGLHEVPERPLPMIAATPGIPVEGRLVDPP
jgi:hypothetical protein